METYRQYIDNRREKWIGRRVMYDGEIYNVVDVDYNGALLIDKKAQFTDTTAVEVYNVQEID